jgi:hypothetical protein
MKLFGIILLTGLSFFNSIPAPAQQQVEIQELIETFFEGMRLGDTSMISNTIADHVELKSIYTDSKSGETKLVDEEMDNFIKSISGKPDNVVYDERLLSFDIKIDGPMAIAWTPYRFYLNEKFSHCGVNLFTLAHYSVGWRIVSITDTRRRADCEPD